MKSYRLSGLSRLQVLSEQIRIYQFPKNLLVFVPLFSSHLYHQQFLALQFLIGFLAFCCIAGSGYIINDLVDLSYDRQHDQKRHRPLAKNDLTISTAIALMVLLFTTGMLLSSTCLPLTFEFVLLVYLTLVLLYSTFLKKVVLLDVFTLASFYSLRIISGMLLIPENGFSIWLISFAFFFFLSLAYIKRYSELVATTLSQEQALLGRNYFESDKLQIRLFGTASAFTAVLVLMLYINLSNVVMLYHHPQLLWLTCPIILFWLMRIWTLVTRGQHIEDPIVFALTDRVSLVSFILVSLIYLLAT